MSSPINAEFSSSYDNSYVVLDAGMISYRTEGRVENPTLLLLHGLNAHSGTWRKNIPFLSTETHVLAPSLPPWHGSPRDLDIAFYIKIVEEFLVKLGLHGIAIAGNSMGGWIGMLLAGHHPGLVSALVLEDSAGIASNEDDLPSKIDSSGIPVLIIWGSDDMAIQVEAGRYLHSKIRASGLEIFRGTRHVPHWEKPNEFNQVVRDFLRKVK